MSKKILLIESDAPFAEELSSALEARGLETRTTADGREGYELAREWTPDAIVLCVELPGMSGYVICQKLKKDEALKSIPLIITSAEATQETFEKHKTLKVRAEDYLLKPFDAEALIASLGAFVEIPEAAAEEPLQDDGFPAAPFPEEPLEGVGLEESATPDEEELVALEEEAGIEQLDGEPLGGGDLPALDLGSLPDDDGPAPESGPGPGLEDDLKLLDEAFEGLSGAGSAPAPGTRGTAPAKPPSRRAPTALDLDLVGEGPMDADDLDAAAASLPEGDDRAARAALGGLDLVADEALDALGGDEPSPAPTSREPEPESGTDLGRDLLGGLDPDLGLDTEPAAVPEQKAEPARPAVRSAGNVAEVARLEREIARKDQRIQDLEARLRETEDDTAELERRVEEAEQRAADGASRVAAAEAQASAAKSRLDGTLAQSKRLDADLKSARARAEHAESALDDERRRADDAEARAAAGSEAQEKIDALEREVDELKTELVVARGEAEGARSEVEKRTAELKKRVQDLEMSASKNEERVVKAYLKIKNDEKVREKTKKALAIASQLLDEGAAAGEPASAEKPRTAAQAAAAALGREQ